QPGGDPPGFETAERDGGGLRRGPGHGLGTRQDHRTRRRGGDPRRAGATEELSTLYTVRTQVPDPWTQPGSVSGAPGFMAPEQARGEVGRLDERCDVFGLGAILCVILTGQSPFAGGSRDEKHRQAYRGELSDAFGRLDACRADPELVRLAKACL